MERYQKAHAVSHSGRKALPASPLRSSEEIGPHAATHQEMGRRFGALQLDEHARIPRGGLGFGSVPFS